MGIYILFKCRSATKITTCKSHFVLKSEHMHIYCLRVNVAVCFSKILLSLL